jgi:predicted ATPase
MTVPLRIARFFGELKRRRVYRAALAYCVAAAAIIQLTDPVAAALSLPATTLTVVVIAAVAGLPVVMVLSWLFDVRRDPSDVPVVVDTPVPRAAQQYRVAAPHTPLVGRTRELDDATALLRETRLLTITGPGGIGKTRLSVEIAIATRLTYTHGVCMAQLAAVETSDALPAALADALGFILSARELPSKQLAGFLAEKQLLILLDNFEQIVDGGALIAELMAAAPGVKFLVTSRRRLRINGETVFTLDALSLPAASAPAVSSDAALLFVQVAKRSDPRFNPGADDVIAIGEICRILDGIPLAIELAAASVGVLSCAEIAHEITQSHLILVGARRDLPPRHQSLHAAFESSWRLLDDEERRACRRLSVFRNGFDRETASAIAGADLRLIVRLAEMSLLQRPALGRFQMLEMVRQFASEKLDADTAESTALQRAHASYFLQRAGELSTRSHAERQVAIDAIAEWIPDVLGAWTWAVAAHAVALLHEAAAGMHLLLEARGRSVEGVELFQRAAACAVPPGNSLSIAPLLSRQAAFLVDCGRIPEATRLIGEAIALLRQIDDVPELAFALSRQCSIALATGDFRSPVFEECLSLYRSMDDERGVAWALNAIGGARHASGEYDAAKALYAQSIALFRSIGLEDEAWPAINNSAGIAQLKKDFDTARDILSNALDAFRDRRNPRALSFLLNNLGYVVYLTGDHIRARDILAESITLARAMGYRSRLAYSLNTLASLESDHGNAVAAAATHREALAVAVSAGEATLAATILVGIARDLVAANEVGRAVAILAAVERHTGCDQETITAARVLRESLGSGALAEELSFDEALALSV